MKQSWINAINALAARDGGRLTPETVVLAARDPASPLHDFFDWDNATAAHKHRIEESRRLIRTVTLTFTVEQQQVRTVAYVHDPACAPGDQGYISVNRVRTDADLAREVLVNEFSRVTAAMNRAKSLSAVLGLADEVDHLAEHVGQVHSLVLETADINTMASA